MMPYQVHPYVDTDPCVNVDLADLNEMSHPDQLQTNLFPFFGFGPWGWGGPWWGWRGPWGRWGRWGHRRW